MEFIALQKFVKVSPKKMRLVADVARKMTPVTALEKLPFVVRRGSEVLLKVVKSALANARQKGASDENLIFKEIQIGEGPRLKRGRAASRGRWHPYKRRMSHVRVVLITKELKNLKTPRGGESLGSETEKQKSDGGVEPEKSEDNEKVVKKDPKTVKKTLKSIISGKGGKK